jgi:hypothetical protein
VDRTENRVGCEPTGGWYARTVVAWLTRGRSPARPVRAWPPLPHYHRDVPCPRTKTAGSWVQDIPRMAGTRGYNVRSSDGPTGVAPAVL